MTRIKIPYQPRVLQRKIHKNLKRWNLFVCHRRFGKTVMAVNELIKGAATTPLLNPRLAYLAPLYKQAKAIAWDYLKHYSRPIPGIKINESELRIDYPNGGRVQLFGCDNPDALRGQYFDGVVLDEYAQMPGNVFSEVVRPALSDRKGWAIFTGTPKGKNSFYQLHEAVKDSPDWLVGVYKASETGIIDKKELDDAKLIMDEDDYLQEYECSFESAIKGAYYSKQLQQAQDENRITSVPYDPAVQVHTVWDLGIGDATAIWFAQIVGQEIHIIDYYEASGEGFAYYAKYLKEKNYVYGTHYAPHDIEARELGSGKSRKETALKLGIRFVTVARLGVDDGIDAARNTIPKCWFDKEKCKQGLDALWNYHKEYDEKRKEFKLKPFHDWSSHAADAFRYLAVGLKKETQVTPMNIEIPASWMG